MNNRAMDIAWTLLKEFYIGQEEDGEGYHSAQGNLPNYGMEPNEWAYTIQHPYVPLEPNPQDPQQYLRGGSSPRLRDSGSFVGARVGRDTDDSDESIAHLANVLGHEYTHDAIEGEMENFATEKFGSPQLMAPVYSDEKVQNPFQIRPVLNQSEIDADTQRLDARTQAKKYAHEYGAHQSDQPSQYAVNSRLSGRSDTGDMYNQYLQPLQSQAMNMLPPMQEQQPEMIQQGEPMDLAMRLLKMPFHGTTEDAIEGGRFFGGIKRRGLRPREPHGGEKGLPSEVYFTDDPGKAAGYARTRALQHDSRPVMIEFPESDVPENNSKMPVYAGNYRTTPDKIPSTNFKYHKGPLREEGMTDEEYNKQIYSWWMDMGRDYHKQKYLEMQQQAQAQAQPQVQQQAQPQVQQPMQPMQPMQEQQPQVQQPEMIQAGEPMDIAFEPSWILLKRNFIQRIGDRIRYGPVKYYHGTTADNAKNIMNEGLQTDHSERAVRGQGTYVSQNPAFAGKFATDFGTRPVEQQGMVGVRSKVPMDSFKTTQGNSDFANQGVFSQSIPPQYLVNLKPNQYSQQNVPTDYQEYNSAMNGYSAGDWSQPVASPNWEEVLNEPL